MPGTFKGFVLAAINLVFVAVGLGVMFSRDPFGQIIFTIQFGLAPALITGILVGWLGDTLTELRLFVMVIVPVGVVGFLGMFAYAIAGEGGSEIYPAMITLACIPTTVCASILERWTRPAKPQPVPPAIVA